VQFVDSSGTVRLEGTLTGGIGAPLIWKAIWNAGTSYSVGDAVLILNTGRYFLAICVAPNVNVNPFTDAGGPAQLGAHWFLEY